MIDVRTATRRVLVSLALSAVFSAALTLLFCPVRTRKRGFFAHLADREVLSFVPAWRIDGRPLDETVLAAELFLGFLVFASAWFVYTDFDPPRR